MIGFDLAAPTRLIYPMLSKSTPIALELWAWRELKAQREGRRGWSIARRHAQMVRERHCHYDKRRKDDVGDVHSGHLHCFCREHKQGVEYGSMPRFGKPAPLIK